jgi:23S rRNA pseudouridine1911/1915/1917 synthase
MGKNLRFEPEDIPLEVMYEDDSLAIINKCENMVVHPGVATGQGQCLTEFYFATPTAKIFRGLA